MPIDANQLIAFDRIVREGSFNRAARALDLSQAAISGRIQVLETEIGTPLFIRGGRRITLTSAGEAFLPYARRTLAVLAEGADAARQAHTGAFGRVSIGAIESVTDTLLLPVVARFRETHPQVVLSIRTGHTSQIVQELADGIVRLGIVTWQYVTGTSGLEVIARLREPLVAVVAPPHPLASLARHGLLAVEDVVRQAAPFHETIWGSPADARITGDAARDWADHELPPGLMRGLILRGIGAGFLPASIVADDLAAGRLVALPLADATDLTRELALISLAAEGPLPPPVRAFADLICQEIKRLGVNGEGR